MNFSLGMFGWGKVEKGSSKFNGDYVILPKFWSQASKLTFLPFFIVYFGPMFHCHFFSLIP